MQMQRLKGLITRHATGCLVIADEKSGTKYRFNESELAGAEIGERVDLLIAAAEDPDGLSTILSIKSKKKVKPIKIGNFNTLVGHMIKTRDRLIATLAEASDSDAASDLREKIDCLDRGISLFS